MEKSMCLQGRLVKIHQVNWNWVGSMGSLGGLEFRLCITCRSDLIYPQTTRILVYCRGSVFTMLLQQTNIRHDITNIADDLDSLVHRQQKQSPKTQTSPAQFKKKNQILIIP